MHFIVLTTIVAVTLGEYLVAQGFLPTPFAFLPELLTAIVSLYIVVVGVRSRFGHVRSQYWLVFGAILVTVLCGIVADSVDTGPIVAGARRYLRAIPFFFLPAVVAFSEAEIRTQLRLLLAICLMQLPLAIAQRLTVFEQRRYSGDDVSGTLMISSVMSIFLICAACFLVGMVMRRRISKTTFLMLFVILLIPTTINETKATMLLLPIGLFAAFLLASERGKRFQVTLSALALLTVFGSIFVPVYNYFNTVNNPYPYTIADFFTRGALFRHHIDKETDIGSRKEPGRVDALVVPVSRLSRDDPAQLLLGVGIGNASYSALGRNFTGAHYSVLGRFTEISSASTFLVEIGLIGTSLVFLLYWLILRDACAVARSDDGIRGAIAIGMAASTVLVSIATFYKAIHGFDSLSYMFWYFSGVICARRMELALAPGGIPSPRLAHPAH